MGDIQYEVSYSNPESDQIKDILKKVNKIAIVGLSPKKKRESNLVARYLMEQGYEIVPVNPGQTEILGQRCFKSLKDIPFQIDLVDLFLNPTRVPPVVDQAIEIGVGIIWMQLGIVHNAAAEKAEEKGITVIMDRCIKQEYEKMG